MRKILLVALGVVSIGLAQSGSAMAEETIVKILVKPDVETCDSVYVWDVNTNSYHVLGKPCNEEPAPVVPEESAS